MKTSGQILKETRLSQKLEVEDVSRVTKIRPNFVTALEADDYTHLPNGATARGFIRNYSEFLNLVPGHVLAVFRRDFVENQLGQIVPRGLAEPAGTTSFWTPKTTVVAAVALVFTLFGIYIFYQFRILTGPPMLQVTYPPDNLSVTDSSTEVQGTTDPEATIAVNGQLVALDKGGTFSLRLPLSSGQNQITIIATGKSGRTTTIIRSVNLTTNP